jgi:hypothetical protein
MSESNINVSSLQVDSLQVGIVTACILENSKKARIEYVDKAMVEVESEVELYLKKLGYWLPFDDVLKILDNNLYPFFHYTLSIYQYYKFWKYDKLWGYNDYQKIEKFYKSATHNYELDFQSKMILSIEDYNLIFFNEFIGE